SNPLGFSEIKTGIAEIFPFSSCSIHLLSSSPDNKKTSSCQFGFMPDSYSILGRIIQFSVNKC
ncbi:MAG: hypothetical protein WCR02_11750, partial [Sphaerochaetaceae bacterium]